MMKEITCTLSDKNQHISIFFLPFVKAHVPITAYTVVSNESNLEKEIKELNHLCDYCLKGLITIK